MKQVILIKIDGLWSTLSLDAGRPMLDDTQPKYHILSTYQADVLRAFHFILVTRW
jgi:hypothetical protein